MLKLIKFITYRIRNDKSFLIVYLALIPIVIGIAVYFTNTISHNLHVGVVGNIETVENDSIRYSQIDSVPDTSKLVLNKYDGVVYQKDNKVEVLSTKGEEFNQVLLLLINGQMDSIPTDGNQRLAASNILGFLMMVIGLLGVQIYQFYFKERKGINKRILGTTITTTKYMLSHFTVALGFLFIPAAIVICAAIYIFDITIAIAMWQFILIIFLLCFFATSFGLWINALVSTQEESLLFGNMFAIVGSIISGGFVQVTNNEIFNNIVQVFPQKQVMETISALENNTTIPYLGIIYVIAISLVLIVVGIAIEKRKLPSR